MTWPPSERKFWAKYDGASAYLKARLAADELTLTGKPKGKPMTEDNITTTTITLPVRGDGTVLENRDVQMLGLVKVESSAGTVMYVPDPDNEGQKVIFWVQGIPGKEGHLPEGFVTLTLTYRGM
jgi:hypothetical protein